MARETLPPLALGKIAPLAPGKHCMPQPPALLGKIVAPDGPAPSSRPALFAGPSTPSSPSSPLSPTTRSNFFDHEKSEPRLPCLLGSPRASDDCERGGSRDPILSPSPRVAEFKVRLEREYRFKSSWKGRGNGCPLIPSWALVTETNLSSSGSTIPLDTLPQGERISKEEKTPQATVPAVDAQRAGCVQQASDSSEIVQQPSERKAMQEQSHGDVWLANDVPSVPLLGPLMTAGDDEARLRALEALAVPTELQKAESLQLEQELAELNLNGMEALSYILLSKFNALDAVFDWLNFNGTGVFCRAAFDTGMLVLHVDVEKLTGMTKQNIYALMDRRCVYLVNREDFHSAFEQGWAETHAMILAKRKCSRLRRAAHPHELSCPSQTKSLDDQREAESTASVEGTLLSAPPMDSIPELDESQPVIVFDDIDCVPLLDHIEPVKSEAANDSADKVKREPEYGEASCDPRPHVKHVDTELPSNLEPHATNHQTPTSSTVTKELSRSCFSNDERKSPESPRGCLKRQQYVINASKKARFSTCTVHIDRSLNKITPGQIEKFPDLYSDEQLQFIQKRCAELEFDYASLPEEGVDSCVFVGNLQELRNKAYQDLSSLGPGESRTYGGGMHKLELHTLRQICKALGLQCSDPGTEGSDGKLVITKVTQSSRGFGTSCTAWSETQQKSQDPIQIGDLVEIVPYEETDHDRVGKHGAVVRIDQNKRPYQVKLEGGETVRFRAGSLKFQARPSKSCDTDGESDQDEVEDEDVACQSVLDTYSGKRGVLRRSDLAKFVRDVSLAVPASKKRFCGGKEGVAEKLEQQFNETLELQIDLGSRYSQGLTDRFFKAFLGKAARCLGWSCSSLLAQALRHLTLPREDEDFKRQHSLPASSFGDDTTDAEVVSRPSARRLRRLSTAPCIPSTQPE